MPPSLSSSLAFCGEAAYLMRRVSDGERVRARGVVRLVGLQGNTADTEHLMQQSTSRHGFGLLYAMYVGRALPRETFIIAQFKNSPKPNLKIITKRLPSCSMTFRQNWYVLFSVVKSQILQPESYFFSWVRGTGRNSTKFSRWSQELQAPAPPRRCRACTLIGISGESR